MGATTVIPPLRAVSVSDRVSRSERIATVLIERIRNQELNVGDRLPPESALAQHFGVSRAVVREAIARLKAEGMVETIQGSGAYVRSPDGLRDDLDTATRTSLQALLDLIEVRRVTEGEMAAAAAVNRSLAGLAEIERAFERLREAEASGSDGVAEDCAFHNSIASASGNIYWKMLSEALSRNMAVGIRVTRGNEARRHDYAISSRAEHLAVLDAIRAGNPVAARAAAANHMERAAQRILSAEEDFWRGEGAKVRDLRP